MTRLEELRAEVVAYHAENPTTWAMFVRFTFELIEAGHAHGGAKAVWERMRWETAVNPRYAQEQAFKVNNNYPAFYARRFERAYPQHFGFYRKRVQKSKDQPATQRPPLTPEHFPEEA
jgi:hypothetical protein